MKMNLKETVPMMESADGDKKEMYVDAYKKWENYKVER